MILNVGSDPDNLGASKLVVSNLLAGGVSEIRKRTFLGDGALICHCWFDCCLES